MPNWTPGVYAPYLARQTADLEARPCTWTDERIDDKMDAIDSTFHMLRDEIRGLRTDAHEEFTAFRADFSALQRQLAQIGFGLVGVLLGAMVALIVALA